MWRTVPEFPEALSACIRNRHDRATPGFKHRNLLHEARYLLPLSAYWQFDGGGRMDSTTLQTRSPISWQRFACDTERAIIAGLPTCPGVYLILFGDFEKRQQGSSDIAYIGSAANQNGLRGRIRQYFHPGPTQSTNLGMKRRLIAPDCRLRLGFISVSSTAAAKSLESDLLMQFEREHGELPPYNRQRALDLMGRMLVGSKGGR